MKAGKQLHSTIVALCRNVAQGNFFKKFLNGKNANKTLTIL